MEFKSRIRTFLVIAGMLPATVFCGSSCSMVNRQDIEGLWSAPVVRLPIVKHSWNEQRSHVLIQGSYQIDQTAHRRHPRVVWKNTDWEREITQRVNVISGGPLVAIVTSDGTSLRPLPFDKLPDHIVHFPVRFGWVVSDRETAHFVSL